MMVTALFLAAKVEEVSYPERLFEVIKDVWRESVLFYEAYLCKGLGYNFNIFTPYRSLQALLTNFDDEIWSKSAKTLDFALFSDLILTHKPADIALGVLYSVLKSENKEIFDVSDKLLSVISQSEIEKKFIELKLFVEWKDFDELK